ncbi:hypothetical protein CCP3SC15_2320001 [Gammaproteobacteria bacterium]
MESAAQVLAYSHERCLALGERENYTPEEL